MYLQQHHCQNLTFCTWERNSYICCVLFTDYRTIGSRVLGYRAVAECSIPQFIKSVNVIMSSNRGKNRHHLWAHNHTSFISKHKCTARVFNLYTTICLGVQNFTTESTFSNELLLSVSFHGQWIKQNIPV